MATLMAFFLYFFASALSGNRLLGLLSALVMATSFNVIMAGRVATWDIYCHSFMLGAIFFFYKGIKSVRTSWANFVWAGIFLGLSFLGKGPVAFYALLFPFLISYIWIYRPSLKRKGWPIEVMLLLFIVNQLLVAAFICMCSIGIQPCSCWRKNQRLGSREMYVLGITTGCSLPSRESGLCSS